MSSTRRFSVRRHIRTVHDGMGGIIPFVEYVIGRREGNYPPQERPRFSRSESTFTDKIMAEKKSRNVHRFTERFAKRCLDHQPEKFNVNLGRRPSYFFIYLISRLARLMTLMAR
ncbi:MAG: hypothetical protein E6L04_10485 [Thaumarchaeota archaeon]|nr:MAG: hypothetical protein E6L04_10485 [Nitrososphaerota archaeon]